MNTMLKEAQRTQVESQKAQEEAAGEGVEPSPGDLDGLRFPGDVR